MQHWAIRKPLWLLEKYSKGGKKLTKIVIKRQYHLCKLLSNFIPKAVSYKRNPVNKEFQASFLCMVVSYMQQSTFTANTLPRIEIYKVKIHAHQIYEV